MTALLQSAEAVSLEIVDRLKTIRLVNDCETDIGASVFEGRRSFSDKTMMPGCSLIEADDVITSRPGKQAASSIAQHYVIFAFQQCDPEHPNRAAHAALRDLKRAIFRTNGKASGNFGGKVFSVEYVGRDIGPRADGTDTVVAAIEIAVTFAEDHANP